MRKIAALLERDPSTVSRELRRNGAQKSQGYAPVSAHAQAVERATGGGRRRKLLDKWLWRVVLRGLRRRWSPEQIAGDMKSRYPKQSEHRVSHETIYVGLYLLPRGELRSELLSYLRQARKQRRPRARGVDRRGQIPNMVSISERPASVETRRVAGHWEGDLIKGAGNRSAVATLVERHSRYLVMVRVADSSAVSVCRALARHFRRLPVALRRTLTYDRGKEMAGHEALTQKTRVKIYFADPHSPWQRGSNENTNGLLRQYLPKGEDLSRYTQIDLNRITREMNSRPRKIHGWATPADVYNRAASVALRS
jgi:IS30 family transposase